MDGKSEVQSDERSRENLEVRQDPDGMHHYLDGKRLSRGDEIELLLGDGQWLRGRYDWNGVAVVWPALRLNLAGRISRHTERRLTGAMPLPPSAILRWARRSH
jgi:hypothetical protein